MNIPPHYIYIHIIFLYIYKHLYKYIRRPFLWGFIILTYYLIVIFAKQKFLFCWQRECNVWKTFFLTFLQTKQTRLAFFLRFCWISQSKDYLMTTKQKVYVFVCGYVANVVPTLKKEFNKILTYNTTMYSK